MCGRYTIRASKESLARLFGLDEFPEFQPRYNVAPTQAVPVVRINQQSGAREAALVRWGLIPSWADDPKIGNRMINARAETAASKPAFRGPFRTRRCLIPADGFYEWKKISSKKQPYYITMKDGQPFAFAGLWDAWDKEGEKIESFTILTTSANELLVDLHDRMPVIVNAHDYELWLTPNVKDLDSVQALLQPYSSNAMATQPVSPWVNSPRNDDRKCVEIIGEG
jgi:putative SOS response-associated peptidase YedK